MCTCVSPNSQPLQLLPSIALQDTSISPDSTMYEIIYAIYTDKILPDELPFFSKITLKNAYQSLRAMNYNVSIAKIDIYNGAKILGKGKPQKPPPKKNE
ncbi:TPA: TIGR04141 family sporadically distributed protein [Photobacterium damselae]